MTFSDWINDIRWKYFTNEKAGLIFKELMKEFEMVDKMTENKRYKVAIYDEKAISGYCVLDLEKPSQTARLKYKNVFIGTKEGCDIVCDLLNEQDTTIKRLKTIREEQIQTILKQKRKIKELETELANMTQRFEYELQMKLKYHSKLIECEKR